MKNKEEEREGGGGGGVGEREGGENHITLVSTKSCDKNDKILI